MAKNLIEHSRLEKKRKPKSREGEPKKLVTKGNNSLMYKFTEQDVRLIRAKFNFDSTNLFPSRSEPIFGVTAAKPTLSKAGCRQNPLSWRPGAIVEPKRYWCRNIKNSTRTIGTESSMRYETVPCLGKAWNPLPRSCLRRTRALRPGPRPAAETPGLGRRALDRRRPASSTRVPRPAD